MKRRSVLMKKWIINSFLVFSLAIGISSNEIGISDDIIPNDLPPNIHG